MMGADRTKARILSIVLIAGLATTAMGLALVPAHALSEIQKPTEEKKPIKPGAPAPGDDGVDGGEDEGGGAQPVPPAGGDQPAPPAGGGVDGGDDEGGGAQPVPPAGGVQPAPPAGGGGGDDGDDEGGGAQPAPPAGGDQPAPPAGGDGGDDGDDEGGGAQPAPPAGGDQPAPPAGGGGGDDGDDGEGESPPPGAGTVPPPAPPGDGDDPARPPTDEDAAIVPPSYDPEALPQPVRRMRELIMEACRAGDLEKLRPLIGTTEARTRLSLDGSEDDPIEFLKGSSGDEEGQEILAILLEVLEAGYVHLDAGTDTERFIWPYFFATPLEKLDARQRVELFKLITAGDYEDMKGYGAYIFYRVGISPEGKWDFFLAGD